MTEIELKAHVADPEKTARAIAGFARSSGECVKRDTYWKSESGPKSGNEKIRTGHPADEETVRRAAAGIVFTFVASIAAAVFASIGASRFVVIVILLGASAVASLWAAVASSLSGLRRAPHAGVKLRIREEISVDGEGSALSRPGEGATRCLVTYKRKELQGDIEVNDEREFGIDNRADFEVLLRDLGFAESIRKEKRTRTFDCEAEDGMAVTIELSLVEPLGWFAELEILAEDPSPEETTRARELLRRTLAKCGIPESAIETRYYTDMLAEASRDANPAAGAREQIGR